MYITCVGEFNSCMCVCECVSVCFSLFVCLWLCVCQYVCDRFWVCVSEPVCFGVSVCVRLCDFECVCVYVIESLIEYVEFGIFYCLWSGCVSISIWWERRDRTKEGLKCFMVALCWGLYSDSFSDTCFFIWKISIFILLPQWSEVVQKMLLFALTSKWVGRARKKFDQFGVA